MHMRQHPSGLGACSKHTVGLFGCSQSRARLGGGRTWKRKAARVTARAGPGSVVSRSACFALMAVLTPSAPPVVLERMSVGGMSSGGTLERNAHQVSFAGAQPRNIQCLQRRRCCDDDCDAGDLLTTATDGPATHVQAAEQGLARHPSLPHITRRRQADLRRIAAATSARPCTFQSVNEEKAESTDRG